MLGRLAETRRQDWLNTNKRSRTVISDITFLNTIDLTKHKIDWDSAEDVTYRTNYLQCLTLESWYTNSEQEPQPMSAATYTLQMTHDRKQYQQTLKITTTWVIKTPVTNNSLSKDYLHPDHGKNITNKTRYYLFWTTCLFWYISTQI